MILCDRDLHELLPLINFHTDDPARPFDPGEQVQPASIDLRLDRCFWVPRRLRGRRISFLSPPLGRITDHRFYRRNWLGLGQKVVVRPGQMLLGRTYELFSIPNGYVGKLEGRSTFARLGLSVHCTGDFINPGWRGRMPLQLINHGRIPIELTPYLDICQLVIVRASGESSKPYGDINRINKYMNDEGEPSRHWIDARIRKLREAAGRVNLNETIVEEFERIFVKRTPVISDRLAVFLEKQSQAELTNPQEILKRFANDEKWQKIRDNSPATFFKWFSFAITGVSISSLFR